MKKGLVEHSVNFRTIGKLKNRRDGSRDWKLRFMAVVRACDISFADYVWGHEKLEPEVDIMDVDPTQTQLAVNLHNRLISCTSGTAFQIVENTPANNGVEAWRQLNHRLDPKTDARLTSLVLTIAGYKIKGKDMQAGLVLWESQLLALERDHKESLSPKVRRALLMNILPTSMQSRVMEHLDRLKTYGEVRERSLPCASPPAWIKQTSVE